MYFRYWTNGIIQQWRLWEVGQWVNLSLGQAKAGQPGTRFLSLMFFFRFFFFKQSELTWCFTKILSGAIYDFVIAASAPFRRAACVESGQEQRGPSSPDPLYQDSVGLLVGHHFPAWGHSYLLAVPGAAVPSTRRWAELLFFFFLASFPPSWFKAELRNKTMEKPGRFQFTTGGRISPGPTRLWCKACTCVCACKVYSHQQTSTHTPLSLVSNS